jgi:glycosyltransferase involved in cell wall biosynthesis
MAAHEREHSGIEVSVIIPVYNEEEAIGEVVERIQNVLAAEDFTYEIIVVDDGSEDQTRSMAESAGARVIGHAYNTGNGAAVKTGIRAAKGNNLVMMDGDGQHDPRDILKLISKLDTYDLVIGARTSASETDFHRDFGNQVYNLFASYICSRRIPDLTSGFRAVKTHIAREFLPLLPNTFSYPTTLTLAVARSGYQYTFHPITVKRRKGKSKINLIQDGTRFFLILFKISTLFSPLKVFIPAAIGCFILGFGYGLTKVLFLGTRYGPTSAMLMTISGVIFLIGLVSEQISQLRFERTGGYNPSD